MKLKKKRHVINEQSLTSWREIAIKLKAPFFEDENH